MFNVSTKFLSKVIYDLYLDFTKDLSILYQIFSQTIIKDT